MKFSKAEIDAIIEASPRTTVPFNKLVLSDEHQARTGGSTSSVEHRRTRRVDQGQRRAAEPRRRQGRAGPHEVCAGGRRLEALTLLVGNGDIPENYPVPVLIVPADKALIASLSRTVPRAACIPPTNSSPSPS